MAAKTTAIEVQLDEELAKAIAGKTEGRRRKGRRPEGKSLKAIGESPEGNSQKAEGISGKD